jgi:hypothetical protein
MEMSGQLHASPLYPPAHRLYIRPVDILVQTGEGQQVLRSIWFSQAAPYIIYIAAQGLSAQMVDGQDMQDARKG